MIKILLISMVIILFSSCSNTNQIVKTPRTNKIISVQHQEISNVGFGNNQRYVCINQGAIINKKMVQIMSQREALSQPVRIMIDDNNILHTDGKNNLYLEYVGKLKKDRAVYSDLQNHIILFVDENVRTMILTLAKINNIPIIYKCVETNNWTIVR